MYEVRRREEDDKEEEKQPEPAADWNEVWQEVLIRIDGPYGVFLSEVNKENEEKDFLTKVADALL